MKKTKHIIGFIGDKNVGKSLASNRLHEKGFYKVSIQSKIEEFAEHLFTAQELNKNRDEIFKQIRLRGCKVHKEYWVNLILVTIPDKVDNIVFDDILLEEAKDNKNIKLYQIYRNKISTTRHEDIETIENNGTIEDFIEKIDKLCLKK